MKTWLLILFAIYFFTPASHCQEEKMVDSIFADWTQAHHPGGAVAVVDDGELVFSNGYGLASLEYEIPITDKTIFNIASVSKQVTAFSMILLAQQGALSLDDEVRKYVPEVPDFGTPITIRHLAHHISGLRNFQNLLTMAGWREGDAMSNHDLLKYIQWQRALNFPVGSEYLYCNTGFNLMATIVERVSGQSFPDWTMENIFAPLEMADSRYRNDMTEVVNNTAVSYDGPTGGPFSAPRPFWDYMGNGNLYTTVGDLAKWMINFSRHDLGGEKGYNQLIQRGVLTTGDTIRYAFGIGTGTYRGLDVIQHGGSIGGYRSNLVYFPKHEFGIVILANYSGAQPGTRIWKVADHYLDAIMKPKKTEGPAMTRSTEEVSVEDHFLERCVGTFDMTDFLVEVDMRDGILYASSSGSPPLVMTPTSDSTFFLADMGFHIIFHQDANGEVNKLTAFAPDETPGTRITPGLREIQNLVQYTGTYYSPELKTSYTLSIRNGQLEMNHPRHDRFVVIPVAADELRGEAWFFDDIRIERDGMGAVTGIYVSNGRVRNLYFERSGL